MAKGDGAEHSVALWPVEPCYDTLLNGVSRMSSEGRLCGGPVSSG